MIFRMTVFLLFLGFQVSQAAPLKLKYFVNDKYTDVVMKEVESLKVNEVCQKNSSCAALKVARGKPFKKQKTEAPLVGNPGANYCWDVGAKNRVLLDEKNNQYDVCVFTDGSMVDAWNLYSKHYPPKVVK